MIHQVSPQTNTKKACDDRNDFRLSCYAEINLFSYFSLNILEKRNLVRYTICIYVILF